MIFLYCYIRPHSATLLLPLTQQPIKKISSIVIWMQVWNLYLSVILHHNPAEALQMIPYQRLIYSATTLLPLQSWLQYDAKFSSRCSLPLLGPATLDCHFVDTLIDNLTNC